MLLRKFKHAYKESKSVLKTEEIEEIEINLREMEDGLKANQEQVIIDKIDALIEDIKSRLEPQS